MKKALVAIITLILLIFSNHFLSNLINASFIDLSFMTGLFFTALIGFFSTDDNINNRFLGDSWAYLVIDWDLSKKYTLKFLNSIPFCISLIYTIISFIITLYIYWDYFF